MGNFTFGMSRVNHSMSIMVFFNRCQEWEIGKHVGNMWLKVVYYCYNVVKTLPSIFLEMVNMPAIKMVMTGGW